MRLIDADALRAVIKNEACDCEVFPWAVDNAPTVDAVVVVHAQWVGLSDGYADGELVYDVWNCSECSYCIDDGTDDPTLLPHYCPNCGAKMDADVRK